MTTGEGGMVVTKSKKINEKVRSLKDFGRPKIVVWTFALKKEPQVDLFAASDTAKEA